MALNTKWKRDMMTPNFELRTNDGSEHQTEDADLKVKMQMRHDGFECQTKDKQRL